ncbi:mitochondrial GTPase 1 [Culicoides brevitarsis]|uniref:mitochondrial GTPase 1 n=1 Tax=Culicoides brevitarsis TaxID=469753 RepID=UPI00307C2568
MQQFRTKFQNVPKNVLTWFPGHMGRSLKVMQQKLKQVDCIIEVHDARIPFSGRNEEFKYTIRGVKPHIMVFNKKDLIENRHFRAISRQIQQEDGLNDVLFTNCRDQKCEGIKRLLPLATKLISESDRFNRSNEKDFNIMIIGVPNVGKSSLINVLRNRHLKKTGAAAVGAVAGITRSVLNKIKISETPKVYLLDTPGILMPSISDTEQGLKLALCACTQDHLVGDELIADYLLFRLNLVQNFDYVELMNLEAPTDDITECLVAWCRKHEKYQKVRSAEKAGFVLRPNTKVAAQFMLKQFRTGVLGRIFLDENLLVQS